MMAFFVFTSQTIFIRFGRYDKYLREYGAFYGIALLQLMMIAAVKVYYIVSAITCLLFANVRSLLRGHRG